MFVDSVIWVSPDPHPSFAFGRWLAEEIPCRACPSVSLFSPRTRLRLGGLVYFKYGEFLPESVPNGLVLMPIGLVKLDGLALGGRANGVSFFTMFSRSIGVGLAMGDPKSISPISLFNRDTSMLTLRFELLDIGLDCLIESNEDEWLRDKGFPPSFDPC
jgi:hypothetical protein|tara:strand:+ start:65 stop:541 length:477 start_codon:yes stop_codon:yes gene_type:complete